ncbi:MAG: CPBP family intramembrane glutamic endopeptidase [Candidatus Hodarchaeales archaeon]|jgi:membrane protease YdiL (CAAX protease family)
MRKYSTQDLWLRVSLFFIICVILIFTFQSFILPLIETVFLEGRSIYEENPTLANNIVRAMNGIVGVGLVYVFLINDRLKLKNVGFEWNKKLGMELIIVSIPVTLIGLIPTFIIEFVFGIITFGEILDIFGIILTFLITIFAIGLGEEILFRGYIQSMLETKYSFPFAAVVSSILFGLLHFLLLAAGGSLQNMFAILFSAFAIGLTFSYTFKITNNNLIFPVAIHGFWDFFIFIFQAEFTYDLPEKVILEIAASAVGAFLIFLAAYLYYTKRLKVVSTE